MTEDGEASLADLFEGSSQLLVYHFMFGPDYKAGCPACSAIADGFDRSHVHLAQPRRDADGDLAARRIEKLLGPTASAWAGRSRGRRRWTATSTTTSTSRRPGAAAVRERRVQLPRRRTRAGSSDDDAGPRTFAEMTGTDVAALRAPAPGHERLRAAGRRRPPHLLGLRARARRTWAMYQWLDRAPLGRNEAGLWFRRRDEY